jgi:hypothetical protein
MVLKCHQVAAHNVDRYCQRPEELHLITFTNFFTWYDLNATEEGNMGSILGKYIHKRQSPKLIRFTDYHPIKDTEGYWYNHLLKSVPFTAEADLLTPESNPDGSYFHECLLRNLITSEEHLETLMQEYSDLHMFTPEGCAMLQEEAIDAYEVYQDHTMEAGQATDAAPAAPRATRSASSRRGRTAPDPLQEFAAVHAKGLTCEQQQVVDALLNTKGLHVLSGAPGCGKTHTIQSLTHELRLRGKKVGGMFHSYYLQPATMQQPLYMHFRLQWVLWCLYSLLCQRRGTMRCRQVHNCPRSVNKGYTHACSIHALTYGMPPPMHHAGGAHGHNRRGRHPPLHFCHHSARRLQHPS